MKRHSIEYDCDHRSAHSNEWAIEYVYNPPTEAERIEVLEARVRLLEAEVAALRG